ncbi:MAG TPA: L-fucose/L-arabinose isomerase family protein [Polyangiaceae bacterium]|nr:L-fucose/L-arabinose isomerase family protein [Polyangiaceae bacterium]
MRLGFIPANRGMFNERLAARMRTQTIESLTAQGIEVVAPTTEQTRQGCVESREEAELCARLFRDKDVQGIIIGAVNFGDEQAAALTVRRAALNLPILIFGCQEDERLRVGMARRDSFCGLLSIGEGLRQVGAKYSVGQRPICFPTDAAFRKDVDWFTRVCRVVHGIKNARYGQIGARPDDFWTCRFDEKQLQRLGPTTVTLDLSEVIGGSAKIADGDPEVKALLGDISDYADTTAIAKESLFKMAKLELFLRRWAKEEALNAFAIQCWTSIQNNYGVCSCTTMSRLGDARMPAACESDILGTLSMHAAMLAADQPSALADWNNLHNDDDDLVNVWHCGVFPKSFAKDQPKLSVHGMMVDSGSVEAKDADGIVNFVVRESPLTLTRITQSADGEWKAALAEGRIEDNEAATNGSYGWCRIENLQGFYRDVLLQHFPHHVAITQANVGNVLWEAFGNYLGFEVYHPSQAVPGKYQSALPFAAT